MAAIKAMPCKVSFNDLFKLGRRLGLTPELLAFKHWAYNQACKEATP